MNKTLVMVLLCATLGGVARAQVVERALPGVHLCASWLGGVAVGDCVRNGHQAGQAVVAATAGRG